MRHLPIFAYDIASRPRCDCLPVICLLNLAAGAPGTFLGIPGTLLLAVVFDAFPETRWLASLGNGGR